MECPIEIRLFGGIDVSVDGESVWGFESRKTMVLLAYVAMAGPARKLSREHLVTLLWPDEPPSAARQNLRQALYSIRKQLDRTEARSDGSFLRASQQAVWINPENSYWLDVSAFEEATNRRFADGQAVDAQSLKGAIQLYQGTFLAGFAAGDSSAVEEWVLAQQERLRDACLKALRILVEHHAARAELAEAVDAARRWVELDPLSEEAHRELMRLYALSGQRSRALAQYEHCRHLLNVELGVAPLALTTELHKTIVADELKEGSSREPPEQLGPWLPLVGRHDAYALLRRHWEEVLSHGPRAMLVTGEEGTGKTRLVRSFIHDASAQEGAIVFVARCAEPSIPTCYQPVRDLVRSVVGASAELAMDLRERLPSSVFAVLATLAPELRAERRHSTHAERVRQPEIAESVAALLRDASRRSSASAPAPVILFIDDVQWCDRATEELLERLLRHDERAPIWLVACADTQPHREGKPGRRRLLQLGSLGERVHLSRLPAGDVKRIVRTQLAREIEGDVVDLLLERTAGLPLAIAQWLTAAWEEGLTGTPEAPHSTLEEVLARRPILACGEVQEIILSRVHGLPTSTRRLLTLAAVIGHTFSAELLHLAADEHQVVVEHGLETLLERWLFRYYPSSWFPSMRERDIKLWNKGLRLATFEFAHHMLRRLIYQGVPPARRRIMHGAVAAGLERLFAAEPAAACEDIAYHYLEAGDAQPAVAFLELCENRARQLCLDRQARWYHSRAEKERRAPGRSLLSLVGAPPSS